MKVHQYFSINILAICVLIFNQSIFACSMDMTSASALVIQEMMKFILKENKGSDLEIIKIQKSESKNFPYWTSIIELSKEDGACQAIGYAADITPTCKINIKRLNNAFVCQ